MRSQNHTLMNALWKRDRNLWHLNDDAAVSQGVFRTEIKNLLLSAKVELS